MQDEPEWLTAAQVQMLHAESLRLFGGSAGIRDADLLESALLAVRAFLFINGIRFEPEQVETVAVFESLAAGTLDQASLAAWLEENSSPRT